MNAATIECPRARQRLTTRGRAMRETGSPCDWCAYSVSQGPSGTIYHPWLVIKACPAGRVPTRSLLRQAGFKFDEWAAPWCITRLTEETPRALLQRIELQDVTRLSWQVLLDHAGLGSRKALIYS
ncbi:hypothetical protein HYR54_00570 [Candidatus Acetothermia bacterium]|nr:hypothetical protein [Candidatus Acetothermia bacterium]